MNNYFELLGIEKKYDIDLSNLDRQYFSMQLKYHPDRINSNSEKQKNLAISIDINKAYAMLKDDLARAEYLLLLNNIVLDDITVRQGISKEQLNVVWNELEFVETTQELTKLQSMLNNKILEKQQLTKSLTTAFQNQNMQDAVDSTIRFKYLKNLINNIQLKIKSCK
ncbi:MULTISPECIES: Fe-S protein assembly co-chaperone HscB [Rickettsieae]|uniref:Fe-S protein assembly co-chaperone HscB n=1 Tax=Rickettsieae TaxID=33988 RepID=UPI001E6CA3D0|nr:Fe-S protein assembly co-chaperone HscB [Rickettsia endosymbiont of Oedothorax gibbosus]MCC8399556.1 co-chaperone HscB [Rickettsia endosymbiont of Platyusa sonomae]MCC8416128.1 co-chaperone HscB [Rickettsia endosymbiont of Gnoriste bilineata]UCM85385.1 MAG: co-chaperone HscB [Rickettsia endosymbiont of Culicoides impunctatus]